MGNKSLINIDGKPLEKLITVISEGIGKVYKPTAIRKEADAEAYAIGVISRAKANAVAESQEIEAAVLDRIQERLIHKETNRQDNIESINEIAFTQISSETEVSEEPVDSDWISRFYNIAQDISNDEMRLLWGRILAGEVKQPNTYSLRTLELLKNLTKSEAEVFTRFAKASLTVSNTFIYNPDNGKLIEKEFGITFGDRLMMAELGLLTSKDDLEFSFNASVQPSRGVIRYGDKGIIMNRSGEVPKQAIKALILSSAGAQLSKLISHDFNMNYAIEVGKAFQHVNSQISLGDIVVNENGGTVTLNETEFIPKV